MDRVRGELGRKQAEEARRFASSPANLLSGVGPDGGMGAHAIAMDSLAVTGEWNSKTVEDYVAMVREELRKEGIEVTPPIEELMLDKMVRDEMPKSAVEYVLRKAAGNSLFGLPAEVRKSPLQQEIEERGEVLYNPTKLEKGLGWAVGAAGDFASMGGLGGGVASGLRFVGTDIALNAVIDTVDSKRRRDVPSVVLPEHRQEWMETERKGKEEKESVPTPKYEETETQPIPVTGEPKESDAAEQAVASEEKRTAAKQADPERSNTNGWHGILTTLGLDGIGDIGHNAGYILAMLPDILLGMFTGKTQSLGIRDNLVPIASIMAGLFVRNPLLKMTLIGLGGANLINKAGHEQLAKREALREDLPKKMPYRRYEDEQMNPRIRDAEIRGSALIATLDGIPVTISLPERVVDAYAQGALPLGTLANAVLRRCDQMHQISDVRERFEEQSRTEGIGRVQR